MGLNRGSYRWLTPEAGDLYASFAPEQARPRLEECGVTHALLVQAADTVGDTEYMLDVDRRHQWILGVVGWVQLDRPGLVAEQLDRWQQHSSFRGVRHLVHDDPRKHFLSLATVRQSLRLLADRSIPFEVPDAWPRHLAATVDLAAALPDLRIVVDHLDGRDAVREYLRHYADTVDVRDVQVHAVHTTGDPDTLVAEWAASGVVVTTGLPYRMPYVAVITVGPEGITSYRDYWNLAVVARALTPIDATGDAV